MDSEAVSMQASAECLKWLGIAKRSIFEVEYIFCEYSMNAPKIKTVCACHQLGFAIVLPLPGNGRIEIVN